MKRPTSNFTYQPRAMTSGKGASPAHGAVDFLRTHDRMATLLPAVTRLAELQKECSSLLPESFHVCTVVQFEAGCLVFSAPNAALAAKLKQRMPKLQEALSGRGWQVDVIRVKVSVSPSFAVQPAIRKEKHLPRPAMSALSELEQGLEASPRNAALKAAIQTMLQRHQAAQKK